jgi:Carboxypeptidase regulatory-like domain/TonB-dependent Receptor Plug Domain
MRTFAGFLRRFTPWMFVALLSFSFQSSSYADDASATLSVAITDTSGAVIQGATVVIRNVSTNQEQRAASGKDGNTTFSFLKPGHYSLVVSKQSFSDVAVDNINLSVGDEKHLRLVLKAGSAAQTVTVDGSGLTINTTDGSVSTVIDRKFVENTPLNGRSFQDLISLTPGIVTQSPQSGSGLAASGDFSVNGQRTESNYYTVDGLSANTTSGNGYGSASAGVGGTLGGSTALGTTQAIVSVDALQEFRVLSSTYSAEYGRAPGGQFSLATRSGTNVVHGSAFDYLRNNAFDANDWFNDYYAMPSTALRQNDFGGTLGGPIIIPGLSHSRNQTFAFGSYEGLRLTQPTPAGIQYVPDTFLRQQANPVMQPILNAFPVQNGVDYGTAANPSLAQFIKGYSLPSRLDSTSIRIDETINSKVSIFFRFSDTPSSSVSRAASSLATTHLNTQTYSLGITSQFTGTVANEFRLGYAPSDSTVVGILDGFGGAVPIDLAAAVGATSSPNAYPIVVLSFAGIGQAEASSNNSANRGRPWNITDKLSLLEGTHHLSFGADYRYIKSLLTPSSPEMFDLFLGNFDTIPGAPSFAEVLAFSHPTLIFNEIALYVQDEWRVHPRLGVSMGIRWEADPPPSGAHGTAPYTLLGNIANPSTLTLGPPGTPLWSTPWYNFAPRLGLAWTAHDNAGWETVFRTGGGVFYDTVNTIAQVAYDNPGTAATAYPSTPLPYTPAQLNLSLTPTTPYGTINAFPQHLQLPYTLEWNASVQQALGRSQSLTISYVAANGRRLLTSSTTSVAAQNPNFTYVGYVPSGITSNYQALQTQFQRTLSNGIQALASYTWSHSIDYGTNDGMIPQTRGNSDFDVRNNLQIGISWNIPGVKSSAIARAVLNNWSTDGRFLSRTGFPIPLAGSVFFDPSNGSEAYSGLNLVPNQPIYLYGSQYPGGRIVNSAAFASPSTGLVGDAPRNFVRGFGEEQLNIAIRRDFPLHDAFHLQFRAESFNILNHPNFGYVDPNLTDATFGQATQTLNQSLGTLASQYQQGGPRSMQFALKILF